MTLMMAILKPMTVARWTAQSIVLVSGILGQNVPRRVTQGLNSVRSALLLQSNSAALNVIGQMHMLEIGLAIRMVARDVQTAMHVTTSILRGWTTEVARILKRTTIATEIASLP